MVQAHLHGLDDTGPENYRTLGQEHYILDDNLGRSQAKGGMESPASIFRAHSCPEYTACAIVPGARQSPMLRNVLMPALAIRSGSEFSSSVWVDGGFKDTLT